MQIGNTIYVFFNLKFAFLMRSKKGYFDDDEPIISNKLRGASLNASLKRYTDTTIKAIKPRTISN